MDRGSRLDNGEVIIKYTIEKGYADNIISGNVIQNVSKIENCRRFHLNKPVTFIFDILYTFKSIKIHDFSCHLLNLRTLNSITRFTEKENHW